MLRRLNALSEGAARKVREFFVRHALVLAVTMAVGVFAYGYELTHLTFSIDEELRLQDPDLHIWLEQRRWGMYLLQRFLLPHAIYPFTNAALAIIFLSLSAVLLVHEEKDRSAQIVFCALFVSFPTFAHIELFGYMGAHVALALLLVVVAERLVAAAQSGSRRLLVPSVCALTVATATHQSLLFAFPTALLFSLTVAAFRAEVSFKAAAVRVGLGIAVAVVSVGAFQVIGSFSGAESNGYVEGFFRWGSASTGELLRALRDASVPYLTGKPATWVSFPTQAVALVVLLTFAVRSKEPRLTTALTVLLALSPFLIHLTFGTWMSSRSLMALPIAFAALWYLAFSLGGPALRAAIAAFTCYLLVLHSSAISKVSLAQELTYKADSLVASRVLDLIYDTRPRLAEEGIPIAFVGMLDPPRSSIFEKEEAFGGSFWQWEGGNPFRMILFLESLGLPMNVAVAAPSEWPRARALAKDMPSWPDRSSVQFRGGLVIVKLSEPRNP